MASDGMIYEPSFMKTGLGIKVTLRLLPRYSEAAVLVLLIGRIYEVRQ
jgi:hypothetical protein